MKKIFFTSALSILTTLSFSQNKIEYANFIQGDTAIKWAAIYNSYVNLTPANPNFNLSNYFFNKLQNSPVKAFKETKENLSVIPYEITYKDLVSNLLFEKDSLQKANWIYDFQLDDATEASFRLNSTECGTCLNNLLSFFKVKQLIYYKNNQLLIKNILINPLVYKKNSEETKEDALYAETMNICFDSSENNNTNIPITAKFINRTCNLLKLVPRLDNNFSESRVLTHNWSLGSILYRDLKANKIKAYNTDNNIYPTPATMINYKKIDEYHNYFEEVSIYDAQGNQVGTKKVLAEKNYDSLYNFNLIQDFYFDFKTEKLYSKMIAFIPQMNVVTSSGIGLGLRNYWGIVFPENKKKAIPKQKK